MHSIKSSTEDGSNARSFYTKQPDTQQHDKQKWNTKQTNINYRTTQTHTQANLRIEISNKISYSVSNMAQINQYGNRSFKNNYTMSYDYTTLF